MSETRVAIVTGASSGIGRATAIRLARDGLAVALAARRGDELAQTAAEIEAAGGQALAVPTDLRNQAEIAAMVEAAMKRWDRIDVLVNNAGLGYSRPVANLDLEQLREQVEVNLIAVIECAQAVIPAMARRRSGHIINVSSIAGLIGLPGSSVYSATKFGVNGFSEALRREVDPYGIRVSMVCPGFVATDFSPRLKRIAESPAADERLPGVMTPEYVAGRIAGLVRHPKRRIILPRGWWLLVAMARALPWLTDRVLGRYANTTSA